MSEMHGEPLAPGDDSGWRIHAWHADGKVKWVQHEPSGLTVFRYSDGYTTASWSIAGMGDVQLQSARIEDACAEAWSIARERTRRMAAMLDGEQRSPDNEPDNR